MTPETKQPEDSPHLTTLRRQFRTAILTKRKADARGILGKLVAMSVDGDGDDRRNLDELIKGVASEFQRYTDDLGPIKKRLQNGTTLEVIQQELSLRIPHWRAFANDLSDLQLVRDGLPANEDPKIKDSLKELEKKLAHGSVQEVLAEWEQLGEPKSAAGGLFVQIVEEFAAISDNIDQSHWNEAEIHATRLTALLEADESSAYKDGCLKYLKPLRNRNTWELLIVKKLPEGKDRRKMQGALLQELIMAKDEISRQMANNSKLKELLGRVENAIDYHSSRRHESPQRSNGLKVVIRIAIAVILIILAIWIYMRSTADIAIKSHFKFQSDSEAELAHNCFVSTKDI